MDKKDRLNALIEYYGTGKPSQFAGYIGVAPSTISSWRSRNAIDYDLIFAKCKDISASWLLSGEGDMFGEVDIVKPKDVVSLSQDVHKKIGSQFVPIFGVEAIASILSTFCDQAIIPESHLQIPNLTKVDGAVYVTGDSMYPILKSGDIVIFQQIHNIDYIVYGNIYLISFHIDGDDYIVLKYIKKSEDNTCVKLVSHNQHHSDLDIPCSSIRSLALVKASVRYNSL